MGENTEEYEILDLSEYRDDWIRKVFGDVSKQSAAKQLIVGGVTGWCAGFLFLRVGKLAAASLGTTIFLVQVAQHQGYIKVNWNKLEQSVNKAKKGLTQEANRRYPGILKNIQQFFQQNIFIAGGFAGGFFLGIAY